MIRRTWSCTSLSWRGKPTGHDLPKQACAWLERRPSFQDVDKLRSESPAGVYLIVGCKKDKVAVLYVGQSSDVFRRTLEHQIVYEDESLPAEQDRRLTYHLLKTCDEIYHFQLAQFAVKEKETRTLAEGLWCLVAGTFQVNKEWLEFRRKFGLVNVGDRVRGGNSTHCFDKPREESAGATGEHGFQNGQWKAYKGGKWHLRTMAARHRAAGRDKMAEDVLKILKLSQAGVRQHLGGLLLRGELIYQPPTTTYCRMFKSTLNRDFERDLKLVSDRWSMRLVDGQPNASTDFVLWATEEDHSLFSGASLAFSTSVEDHEIAGLQALPWLQADSLDLKALSDDGRAGLSTLGKKTLADMMQDPTSLSSKAYWMPLRGGCSVLGSILRWSRKPHNLRKPHHRDHSRRVSDHRVRRGERGHPERRSKLGHPPEDGPAPDVLQGQTHTCIGRQEAGIQYLEKM